MTRQEILSNVFLQLRNAGFVYNKGDFARRLNYDPCHMSSAFSGSRKISDKVIARIREVFPQVNEGYLRTGFGNVLNSVGPRQQCDQSIVPGAFDSSLLSNLLAERESLMQNLGRIDQMIAILSPRDMKNAS